MKIKRFNESSIDDFLSRVDSQREWINDFLSDLEIDFPGTKCILNKGNSPQISESDVLSIEIPNKTSGNRRTFKSDDELGWTRKDLLKYVEDKISFLVNTIDDLSCIRISLQEFGGDPKPIYSSGLDISSAKFLGRYKERLKRISKIKIYLNHGFCSFQ